MAYKHTHDFKKLLAILFQKQPAWVELADAYSVVIQRNIVQARRYIERLRDSQKFRKGDFLEVNNEYMKIEAVEHRNGQFPDGPKPERIIVSRDNGQRYAFNMESTQERPYLVANCRMLGFELASEEFNNEDFARIIDNIGSYYSYGGTDRFIDFLGFIKNARFQYTKLWAERDDTTTKYTNLQPIPGGDPVWEGGDWYQTSHVWLEYDLERVGELPEGQLRELFFKLAPIHLVLDAFGGFLKSNTDLYLTGLNSSFTSIELVSSMPLRQEEPTFLYFQTPITNYMSLTFVSGVEYTP